MHRPVLLPATQYDESLNPITNIRRQGHRRRWTEIQRLYEFYTNYSTFYFREEVWLFTKLFRDWCTDMTRETFIQHSNSFEGDDEKVRQWASPGILLLQLQYTKIEEQPPTRTWSWRRRSVLFRSVWEAQQGATWEENFYDTISTHREPFQE